MITYPQEVLMMRRRVISALAVIVLSALASGTLHAQQTNIRVFAGGQNQRPDLMRKLFDQFEKARPGVKVQIETGAETSDAQRQYLSTVLNNKDPAIDVFMIDIVNPTQYANAGWIEPLDAFVGSADEALKAHLPVYASSNVVKGKLMAMPAFADAMFLYYRKDLLSKYKLREPRTWDDLAAATKTITEGEKNPNLQGLSIQGAPIEGAVCTFLLPYWSQGKAFNDAAGRITLDKAAAVKGLNHWLSLVDQGVIGKNVAEVKTGDTVTQFKTGNLIFAINWGFAWDRFKDDGDSQVKGKVGVAPLPAIAGGRSATCVGGSQWAVSAFSRNKAASADLVKFMSQPSSSKFLAIEGSFLPVFPGTYTDPDVTRQVPWFLGAGLAVAFGKSRPLSSQYSEVSDVIRVNTSDALARKKTPQAAVDEIDSKLQRVMR
jgi:multiple sugar transport system substrate-binding protein